MPMTNGLYFDTEEEAVAVLEEEGKRLLEVAQKVWRDYQSSYTPKKYVRTGDTLRSMKLGSVIKTGEDTLGIMLRFESDLAYHPSVVNKSSGKPEGHALMLISSGWTAHKLEQKFGRRIEHFTHYQGFDYIGKVMEEFNSSKHQGVQLMFSWSGQWLKG